MPESAMVHPGKTIIYLRVVFLKISDVDTVKENYKADIFIQAKWREPCLDGIDPNKKICDMTTSESFLLLYVIFCIVACYVRSCYVMLMP